ncbi:iron uptake porin [Synechococcus sp. GFB01]|uniref:iron uptake porin n=1 Tax=Synechococcus sp. GFB01 TaxID=1662190 RepID=UPI00064F9DF2|nr:iron uptake porin [Synechococcus sp. GFB01]KMM17637.1 porin [Synechococcus sp. GFB01]
MKPFQQLLLVAAGTSLIAPAAAPAAELNLDDVNRYAVKEQVTSISQFGDVKPTDWAYQALSNLIERYGCVAGYPDGTYRGQKAMTRFEAAALLNACLDRVTEVTDELKRLMAEFEKELAILKGRVDGLEAKVGELEASQFSTTTKLKGEASFIIGGVDDWFNRSGNANEVTFNYDSRLSLDTSFSGKDLLRTRLRAGNFSADPFGSASNVFKLDKSYESDDVVEIDRLFYAFPVGDRVRLTVGALVRNTEMLTFLPSAYKSDILDYFSVAGAAGTYNKATGAGAGFSWQQKVKKGNPFLTFDANWVSQNGYADSTVGAFAEDGAQNILAQLGVKGQNWGAAVAYRYGTEGAQLRDPNSAPRTLLDGQSSNSVSFGAFWQPKEAGWIPSISAGFSYTDISDGVPDRDEIWSWMGGLQWKDVFAKGNSAGFAIGQPLFTQEDDDGLMYELFYKFQVTDNISITPAVFYIDNNYNDLNDGDSTFGGVIQATFKF